MNYEGFIQEVTNRLQGRFSETRPSFGENESEPGEVAEPSYLLWICSEVSSMDTRDPKQALKAARWIGWIAAHAEMLGVLANTETRNLIRKDVARTSISRVMDKTRLIV